MKKRFCNGNAFFCRFVRLTLKIYVMKKNSTAIILCFFFGGLGFHRFYLGYNLYGLIQLFTFGGFGIWWFFDFVLLLLNKIHPKNNNYNENNISSDKLIKIIRAIK